MVAEKTLKAKAKQHKEKGESPSKDRVKLIDPQALEAFVVSCNSEYDDVRMAAVTAIGSAGAFELKHSGVSDGQLVNTLLQVLTVDKDSAVRKLAVETVGKVCYPNDHQVVEVLMKRRDEGEKNTN